MMDPGTRYTLLAGAGLRVVVQKDADSTWLRGAGLDAAIAADHLLLSDDSRRDAKAAIEAAAGGDTGALIALLQAT